MKKIFTLALIAGMAISVMAQSQATKAELSAKKATDSGLRTTRIAMEQLTPDFKVYKNGALPRHIAPRAAAAAAAADTAFYLLKMEDGLYAGVSPTAGMYYPMILTKATEDVTFYNFSVFASEEQFGWFLGEVSDEYMLSQDTDLVIPAGEIEAGAGYQATPIFATASGAEYKYGGTEEHQYWYTFSPDAYLYMTKCHMYTSTVFSEDGSDYSPWMLTAEMPYLFGSGIDLSAYPNIGMGQVDTIGTPWGFAGMTTKIDSITIFVISRNSTSVQIGNSLKLALHPVTIQGNQYLIDTDTELASHTATDVDITFSHTVQDQQGASHTMGVVTFPIKKNITGEFFITISGLNGEGANFGLYGDGADYAGYGDTYYIGNGKFRNLFGINALISVNAAIDESGTQALDRVEDGIKAHKAIENGQIVIVKGDKKFNLLGAEL